MSARTCEVLDQAAAAEGISQSDFVEDAIDFYASHLHVERMEGPLSLTLTRIEERLSRWTEETARAQMVAAESGRACLRALQAVADITEASPDEVAQIRRSYEQMLDEAEGVIHG